MSTLTSPSLVNSPSVSGYSPHIDSPTLTTRSPYYNSLSPRLQAPSSSSIRTLESIRQYSPHLRPAPRSSSRSQYADAGTQYTPEGSPPTARGNTASDGPSVSNKRKQSPEDTSMSPPTTQMSGVLPVSPPAEPQPRDNPQEAQATAATVVGQEGGSNTETRRAPDEPSDPIVATGVLAASSAAAAAASGSTGSSTPAKRQRRGGDGIKVMPAKYEDGNPKDLGVLIANMLMELIRQNDSIPLRDGKLTRFHSRAPPGISCHDYLLRLIQHATLSPPILLSMVYYIDRLCALYPSFTISSLTVHRFLITAATVASKGLSDSFWTNPTYARIGGISTSELATLELDFLQRVQWRIVPKPETLRDYYVSLVQRSDGHVLEGEEEDDNENENENENDSDEMQTDPT